MFFFYNKKIGWLKYSCIIIVRRWLFLKLKLVLYILFCYKNNTIIWKGMVVVWFLCVYVILLFEFFDVLARDSVSVL